MGKSNRRIRTGDSDFELEDEITTERIAVRRRAECPTKEELLNVANTFSRDDVINFESVYEDLIDPIDPIL